MKLPAAGQEKQSAGNDKTANAGGHTSEVRTGGGQARTIRTAGYHRRLRGTRNSGLSSGLRRHAGHWG